MLLLFDIYLLLLPLNPSSISPVIFAKTPAAPAPIF
jgi:hypothetical protein